MYFLDVQGTLISDADKTPIRGSREFIENLNKKNIPYMVVTNNTKNSSDNFYEYLQDIGFRFDRSKYLDPLMLLETKLQKQSVAPYGSKQFLENLEQMGYQFDYENPKSVLVSVKEDYNSEEFAQMIDFLLAGANLVGMHETSIYAKNDKRYPGVGAVLKLLEFATSTPYAVVGKPSTAFYDEALEMIRKQNKDLKFEDIIMISDDVKGDLGGAKEMGMKTFFVTSGKYKSAEEIVPFIEEKLRPDAVFSDMQDILEKL